MLGGFMIMSTQLYAGNGDLIVNGKVGAGTSSPAGRLHVSSESNRRNVYLSNGALIPSSSLSSKWNTPTTDGGSATLSVITSDHDTNNGIGLVTGGSIASPVIWMFDSGDRNAFTVAKKTYSGSEEDISNIDNYLTPLFQIRPTGNAGLGTTSPAARLHINAASNKRNLYLSGGATIPFSSLSSKWNMATTDSGPATLSVITNNAGTNNGVGFINGGNVAGPVVWMYGYGGRNAFTVAKKDFSGNGEDISTIDNVLTPLFQIRESGFVGIGTTNPQFKLDVQGVVASNGQALTSDAKFKKNILPIDNPLSKILKIDGVSYEWKVNEHMNKDFDEGRHYGVIAQEIEKVLPEIVTERPDGTKTVAYTEIIPVLIEAIKEQQKEIEVLKKKLSHL